MPKISIRTLRKRADVIAAATGENREEILKMLMKNCQDLGAEIDLDPASSEASLDFATFDPAKTFDPNKTQPLGVTEENHLEKTTPIARPRLEWPLKL